MRNTHLRRFVVLLMALLMACSIASATSFTPGDSISGTSKWINSDIFGAVNGDTKVSIKDDFHTAVNLEWLLTDPEWEDAFTKSEKILYDRKMEIVLGDAQIDPANAEAVGLTSEWLRHDLKLVQTFSSLCGEWEYRNAYGVEPARPYIEAIESIKTMDDLTAYLLNDDRMNISGFSLISVEVLPDPENDSVYMAALLPSSAFSLNSQNEYSYLTENGHAQHFGVERSAEYLLTRLGYSEKEINEMVKACYSFEWRLAMNMADSYKQNTQNYLDSYQRMTTGEVVTLAGNYPLDQQLASLGIKDQPAYLVYEKGYFQAVDSLYQSRYLEEIKGMLMVHTVMELMPLLDEEAYEMAEKIYVAIRSVPKDHDEEPVGQNDPELADKDRDIAEFVFDHYLKYYLPGPMDQIYVAAHCTPELKAEVDALIDDTIDYYRGMIQGVDWMSESAREATVEKLDHLIVRCVYPDQFVDYTDLDFKGCRNGEGGTLPQAVEAINRFHAQRKLCKVGEPIDTAFWDMSEPYKSTTVCNAFYMANENSINILAGIVTEEMYASDMPFERKLAALGTIIGHEITHAFDTTGYKYDKDGKLNPWWSTQDVEAFDLRASRLIKYYNNITPYPGALLYSGNQVSGEAIADMGGVKCMLSIAKNRPGFDYELFFTSYAQLWRVCHSFADEQAQSNGDEHPLNYLRTNVTLMQFDEFHETFDIQPGDGMYMAPSQRISVW